VAAFSDGGKRKNGEVRPTVPQKGGGQKVNQREVGKQGGDPLGLGESCELTSTVRQRTVVLKK